MTNAVDSLKWVYRVVYVLAAANVVGAIAAGIQADAGTAVVYLFLLALTPTLLLRLNDRQHELGIP